MSAEWRGCSVSGILGDTAGILIFFFFLKKEFKKLSAHLKPLPQSHFFSFSVCQSEVEVTALFAVRVCVSVCVWGVFGDSLCESMGTLHFKDRQRAPSETAAGQDFCQGGMGWLEGVE